MAVLSICLHGQREGRMDLLKEEALFGVLVAVVLACFAGFLRALWVEEPDFLSKKQQQAAVVVFIMLTISSIGLSIVFFTVIGVLFKL